MAKIPAWRKVQNRLLKKQLSRGKDAPVSAALVKSTLAEDFYKKNPTVARPSSYYKKHPEEWAEFLRGETFESARDKALAEFMEDKDTVDSPVPLTGEDKALWEYANEPMKQLNPRVDPEFWETQEFKDLIKSSVGKGRYKLAQDISATRGTIYKAPLSPQMIADTRGIAYTQSQSPFILDAIRETFEPPVVETNAELFLKEKAKADSMLKEANTGSMTDVERYRLRAQAVKIMEDAFAQYRPKQAFITDVNGRLLPFYFDAGKDEEFEAFKEMAATRADGTPETNWFKRDVIPVLYGGLLSFQNTLYKNFWTIGGQTEEELVYQEKQNPVGSLISFAFNTAIMLVEGVTGAARDMYYLDLHGAWLSPEQKFTRLQELKSKLAADPYGPHSMSYTRSIAALEQGVDPNKQMAAERLGASIESVKSAWDALYGSTRKELSSINRILEGNISEQEYLDNIQQERTLLKNQEGSYSKMAMDSISMMEQASTEEERELRLNEAIQFQIDSIETRRLSDPFDAFGAATWVREPDRYDKFIRAAAELELQKGEPLTVAEIRRLKDVYTNMWTEIGFQLVFDITNLPIVGVVGKLPEVKRALTVLYKASGEVGEVIKATPVIGDVVRFVQKKSVISVSNKLQQTIGDTFTRISRGYGDVTKFLADVPKLEETVKQLTSLAPELQRARFLELQSAESFLKSISFEDFKKLMDASNKSGVESWGEIIQRSVHDAEEVLYRRFKNHPEYSNYTEPQLRKMAQQDALDPINAGISMRSFAYNFSKSYRNLHRVTKTSYLTDDTVSGWVLRMFTRFSEAADKTSSLNQALKETPMDKWFKEMGLRSSQDTRDFIKSGANALDATLRLANEAKNLWTTLVLSTPRWVITNFVDSAGRAAVAGSNAWDDVITLMNSTQAHFVDEVGFAPVAFSNSLARVDLGFADDVASRLVYEDFKPKYGLFSYWKYELDRLTKLSKETVPARGMVAEAISKRLSKKSSDVFLNIYDGYSTLTRPVKNLAGAFSGGIADFNTAIEFTLRIRLFHKEYFEALARLEPSFISKGLDGLNPASRELAVRMWKASGGNPAKLSALVDGALGLKNKTGSANWTFMLPADFEENLNMSAHVAQPFVHDTVSNISDFITTTMKKTGNVPTPENWKTFIIDMDKSLQDAVQNALSQSQGTRNVTEAIGNKVSDIPDPKDYKGAAPDFSKSNKVVDEAIEKLTKRPFQKSKDLVGSYKESISKFANVEEIDEDLIRISSTPDGKVTVAIGKNLINKKTPEVFKQINEATIKVMSRIDVDVLKSLTGKTADEFEMSIKSFLSDPAQVMVDSPDEFLLIVDTLHKNPDMEKILKKTGQFSSYEGAYAAYREAGVDGYAVDLMRDPTDVVQKFQDMADDVYAPSAEVRVSGHKNAISWAKANEAAKAAGPESQALMQQINDYRELAIGEYRKFLRNVTPGYARYTGRERDLAHAQFETRVSRAYTEQTKLSDTLSEVIAKNPAEANLMMQDTIANFPEMYLNRMGIDMVWDDTHTKILNLTIHGETRAQTYFAGSGVTEYIQQAFFNPKGSLMNSYTLALKNVPARNIRKQMISNLQKSFNISRQQSMDWVKVIEGQAKRMSEITGQPIDTYLKRYGFAFVDDAWQLPKNGTELLENGIITKTDEGDIFFVGAGAKDFSTLVSETSVVFYDDLIEMAKHDLGMLDALEQINKVISVDAKRLATGKITPKQRESFSNIFTRYISEGQAPNASLEAPFKKFNEYLANYYATIRGTSLEGEIPSEAFDALNKIFIRDAMKAPNANANTNKVILDEIERLFPDLDLKTPEQIVEQVNNPPMPSPHLKNVESYAASISKSASPEDQKKVQKLLDIIKSTEGKPEELSKRTNAEIDLLKLESKIKGTTPPAPDGGAVDRNILLRNTDMSVEEIAKLTPQEANDLIANIPSPQLKEITEAYRPVYNKATPEQRKILDAFGNMLKEADRQGRLDDAVLVQLQLQKYVDGMNVVSVKDQTVTNLTRNLILSHTDMNAEQVSKLSQIERHRLAKEIMESIESMKPKDRSRYLFETDLRNMKTRLSEAKDWLLGKIKKQKEYRTIDDIPMEKVEEVLEQKSKVKTELDDAFSVWKSRREFKGFSTKDTESVDTLKDALRTRIENLPINETAEVYTRMLWDVESFQDTFTKAISKAPNVVVDTAGVAKHNIDWNKALFTKVHEYQMGAGMKTWVRNSTDMVNNYESARQAIFRLEEYLVSGKWQAPTLDSQTAEQLKAWRDVAVQSKTEMISTILDGGIHRGIREKGAINVVNETMLDYSDQTVVDQFMKNFFPFWMFPSRSLPFWVKTLATRPELVAAYAKLKRMSERSRIQAGAVTSTGKPLSSLQGYIPIPGTGLWWNPAAMFSAKYVLNITDSADDLYYSSQNDDEMSPSAYIAREFMESSPIFGFTVAPWVSSIIESQFGIKVNKFSIAPEIPLIPRWLLADMLDKANTINIVGQRGWGDMVYPEADWHDFLTERALLTSYLSRIRDPKTENREQLVNEVRQAIMEKGENPIWQQAYKDLTNKESGQAAASFFTGIYPKEFTDGQADLLALRNELNLLKSAMNSEFQSVLFDLPSDAEDSWNQYLETNNSPEGWMYRLYTDIGWVRNEGGDIVRDPEERNKYVALSVQEEINQQAYYEARKRLQIEFDAKLMSTPIGTDYEVVSNMYVEFYKNLDALQEQFPFSSSTSFSTNRPAELIEQDLRDRYFRMLMASRPMFKEGMEFEVYEDRLNEWESRLPLIAPEVLNQFKIKQENVQLLTNLRADQQINPELWDWMLLNSTPEGINLWKKETDSVFDALNNAWKTTYWDEYWNSVGELEGAERDLAEADFANKRPPPTADELFTWVTAEYGDRFTYEEIKKWSNYGEEDIFNIDQASAQRQGEEFTARQEVWNLISWLGPLKEDAMDRISRRVQDYSIEDGSEPIENVLSAWLTDAQKGGLYSGDPEATEKLQLLSTYLKKAYNELGIKEPTREQMVQFMQVQEAQTQFRGLVDEKFPQLATETQTSYDVLIGVQSYYYDYLNLNNRFAKAEKAQWISENPETWAALQTYWGMRKAFGNTNSLWARYYLWQPTVPEHLREAMGLEPGTPPPSASPIPVNSDTENWPVQLKTTVGETVLSEINSGSLSPAALSFLSGVASRHPEWEQYINALVNRPLDL